MVIILQQTFEEGERFLSTLIEGTSEETSFNSNFSISSQHSISERSAVYKQRIDSLFGRTSRPPPLPPSTPLYPPQSINRVRTTPLLLHSFNVRINGEEVGMEMEGPSTSEEEEEDSSYSVISDSLNHNKKRKLMNTPLSSSSSSSSSGNVSSVQITSEHLSEGAQTTQIQLRGEKDKSSSSSILISSSSPIRAEGTPSSNNLKVSFLEEKLKESPPLPPIPPRIQWRNPGYSQQLKAKPDERGRGGVLEFPVEYLGCVPLDGNTTSLEDLQVPLRNLYLDYLHGKNVMSGELAITFDGLRFEAPKIRLVNSFTTIAVWAAIKFVARGEPTPQDFAFMPLISDPEGQDKTRLFRRMDSELGSVYSNCLNGPNKGFRNPPLFACVMREASFSLDCHAFACKCAEDAIVVAANLYQSLVDKMKVKSNKEGESGYGSLTRNSPPGGHSPSSSSSSSSPGGALSPPNTQHVTVNVIPSSTSRGIILPPQSGPSSSCSEKNYNNRLVFSDSESTQHPVRPPRRKKKGGEIPSSNLKRYSSDDSILLRLPHRRKSLKGSNYLHNGEKVKKRVQICTPDELSGSSGSSGGDNSICESIDQVLDRIINPGGMSFNDLKPSYQELLLKVALTLTQDQLYQKSKDAMRKHHQIYMRKNKWANKHKDSSSGGEVSGDENSNLNTQFLNHLLKSFSKITSPTKGEGGRKKSPPNPTILANNNKSKGPKTIFKKAKEEEPFMSFCSGCACSQCSEKCYCSLPSKGGGLVNNVPIGCHPKKGGQLLLKSNINGAGVCGPPFVDNNCLESSGGDCGESEKCYCSLQRVKSNGLKIYNINLDTETSDTDTNSYDLEPFNEIPPHNQISNGISGISGGSSHSRSSLEILSYESGVQTPSRSRLSYSCSPSNKKDPTALFHHKRHSPKSTIGASSFCEDEGVIGGGREKVLLITGSSPSTRVVYKESGGLGPYQGSGGITPESRIRARLGDILEDDHCPQEEEEGRNEEDGHEADDDLDLEEDDLAPEKVLSMKKTAEIAAMFTNLKLDQTTNVVVGELTDDLNSAARGGPSPLEKNKAHHSPPSIDFQASLGYLP